MDNNKFNLYFKFFLSLKKDNQNLCKRLYYAPLQTLINKYKRSVIILLRVFNQIFFFNNYYIVEATMAIQGYRCLVKTDFRNKLLVNIE